MSLRRLFFIICALFLLTSCKKEAGFGGLATISGKVYAFDYTPNGIIEAQGYTPDMKVVIAVKDSKEVLSEIRTNLKGEYIFDRLRKGTYQVYTFTDCDTCTNNEDPVIQEVNITNNKEEKLLPDFIINI